MNLVTRKDSRKFQRMLGAVVAGGCVMANSGGIAEGAEVIDAGSASDNKIVLNENNYEINETTYDYSSTSDQDSLYVYGGRQLSPTESSDSSNNEVTVKGLPANFYYVDIYGGSSAYNSENNHVVINASPGESGRVYGGYAGGSASNNVVDVDGGNHGWIYGGHSSAGNSSNNTVTFNAGTVNKNIVGGRGSGEVSGNKIIINGGTIGASGNTDGVLLGGSGVTASTTSNNSVTINGGTINGAVFGAAGGGTMENNSVNIYNSPDLTGAELNGAIGSATRSNNSLNIHTKDITTKGISGFQNLNFYINSNIQNGDTMLTVTDTAVLYGTQVSAIVEGDTPLTDGDSVTLLTAATLNTDDSTTYRGVLAEGITFEHQLTVEKVDDHRIVATIGAGTTPIVSPDDRTIDTTTTDQTTSIPVSNGQTVNKTVSYDYQTEAVGQTPVVEMQVMSAGFNRLLDWLPPEDFGSADIEMEPGTNESPTVDEEPGTEDTDETSEDSEDSEGKNTRFKGSNGFEIFANMGGSSMRTKTGHGSYVNTKSGGLDVGAARTLGNRTGKLTFAPIFDYGRGSYDTHLGSGVRGSGTARYWAGGMIARQTNDDGFYYEGSFRMGRTDADFASNDFRQGGHPVRLTYDVSSNCYAGHIRVGKVFRLNKQNSAHFYGIYSHNHINGSSTKLSTGETYRFSAADSGLFRLGCRFTRQINDHSRLYSGLAYQYEFNGESDATYKGYTTPGSSTKGSSAMVELGYQLKPTKSSPVMLDLGLVGWMGMQKGVGLQLKFKREF